MAGGKVSPSMVNQQIESKFFPKTTLIAHSEKPESGESVRVRTEDVLIYDNW